MRRRHQRQLHHHQRLDTNKSKSHAFRLPNMISYFRPPAPSPPINMGAINILLYLCAFVPGEIHNTIQSVHANHFNYNLWQKGEKKTHFVLPFLAHTNIISAQKLHSPPSHSFYCGISCLYGSFASRAEKGKKRKRDVPFNRCFFWLFIIISTIFI